MRRCLATAAGVFSDSEKNKEKTISLDFLHTHPRFPFLSEQNSSSIFSPFRRFDFQFFHSIAIREFHFSERKRRCLVSCWKRFASEFDSPLFPFGSLRAALSPGCRRGGKVASSFPCEEFDLTAAMKARTIPVSELTTVSVVNVASLATGDVIAMTFVASSLFPIIYRMYGIHWLLDGT